MSDLPPGWASATLDEIAAPGPRPITDGPFGSNLKTAHYTASGPRVIRLQNIGDGRFIEDEAHISNSHFEKLRAHSVEPEDLLIAGLGERLPRACIAPKILGPAIVKADCFRVRLHRDVSPGFICAMLNSPQIRAAASRNISGVGRPRLNLAKIRALLIPVPPVPEQKRIVDAIEEQFSRIDVAEEAFVHAQMAIRRMRDAIRFAAVRGQLVSQDSSEETSASLIQRVKPTGRFRGEASLPKDLGAIPDGWTWALMGRLARRITVGHVGTMKNEYVPEGVPFLRSQNVREDRFDQHGLLFISPAFHGRLVKSRLMPGDVVIVRSGNVGTACVIPEFLGESNCADLVIIQGPEAIDPYYAALYMNSLARSRVRAGRVGVALTHFNTQSVAELPVPVPPLSEQRRIVAEAQRLMSIVDALETALTEGLKRASRLRSSILAAAFSGNLVPHDPADEPASILLERIAVEQISTSDQSVKRGRRPRATRGGPVHE